VKRKIKIDTKAGEGRRMATSKPVLPVPWVNWEEWQNAKEMLFSADAHSQRRGLERCQLWIHRGRVPAAVEATVVVLTAQVPPLTPKTHH
jgi:hypothetical protein